MACCDTCPYSPTCEEEDQFLADIGLAGQWGEEHEDGEQCPGCLRFTYDGHQDRCLSCGWHLHDDDGDEWRDADERDDEEALT